MFEKTVDNRPL